MSIHSIYSEFSSFCFTSDHTSDKDNKSSLLNQSYVWNDTMFEKYYKKIVTDDFVSQYAFNVLKYKACFRVPFFLGSTILIMH